MSPASGTAVQARSSGPRNSKRRSWPYRRAPTRTSPRTRNAEFERALETAGVEHELVSYDGAPHSFFDRKHEEFAAASEDAWKRVLAFVERYG